MELIPMTYQETFRLIQDMNALIDKTDGFALNMQKLYCVKEVKMKENHCDIMRKLDSDHQNAIENTKARSKNMINEAKRIKREMHALDEQLSHADKYYVKTKKKKELELAGVKDRKYDSNGDYFKALDQIKHRYSDLSRKYSTDILPSLINGLNYLFSSKRKQEYEELIILLNTVDAFVTEIGSAMPEITAETIADMDSEYKAQREKLEATQHLEIEALATEYEHNMASFAMKADAEFDKLLPKTLINRMREALNKFSDSFGKVNSAVPVANNMLAEAIVDYPIADFIKSDAINKIINKKCNAIISDGSIKFPLICSTTSPLSFYIKTDGTGSEPVKQLIHGIMFSFLSSVQVSKLKLSVIDCENHGNSAAPYFDARKKMPELFDGQFYTNYEAAAAKIRALNEEVECISQDVLGTQYASVFGYAKDNPNSECRVELLTVFDFPKGFDEYLLSALENIIVHGPQCGIYVAITESGEISSNVYSKEYINHIAKIRKACAFIQQRNTKFTASGLDLTCCAMPPRNEFNAFFSKYLLINESIKNRGIAFPPIIKRLVDSRDEAALEQSIKDVCDAASAYDNGYGHVPQAANVYPEQVIIGQTQYPQDVFADCFGCEKIKSSFAAPNGRIMLPLSLDLSQSANLLLSFDESRAGNAAAFTHNVIWSFLSALPVTKTDVVIFDAEKKGGSVTPFLGFKKACPDVFDDNIYSNADDIYERLNKLNRQIDSLIQEKLGSRFANLLEYNRNTPNMAEPITLLVIYDFPGGFDARALSMLNNILKNGGKCGVYTIICHNRGVHYSSYDNVNEYMETYKRSCTQIELTDKAISLLPFNLPISVKEPLTYREIDKFVEDYKAESEKIKNKGLSFTDILDDGLFSRTLENGLTIPVGVGDGEHIVPITFGRGSSHHALIAGATGSGKSTLLHTLIMSAMLNYSPDLLNLYLMDFKSGTEFKVYDSKRLPHIKLLALDAMQEFGESILENLVSEIGRRSEMFKSVGASTLGEYVKLSGVAMPKILIIMDEFQVLYNDSTNRKVANHCAELTKRIVTEGRSYGMHLLMATQSTKIISNLTIETGTIEQMRIRIGLKCGEWDANYLFTERNDAKALKMMKGPIGTAVMNEEYTEKDLIAFRAAYCDDATQKKYLDIIANELTEYKYDLQTFEGSKVTPLLDTEFGSSGLGDEAPLAVEIGSLIKVAPPLRIVFDRRRKHNTLICGSGERMSENLMNLYSLAILKNNGAKLYCFDGERLLGPSQADRFYEEYARFGSRFTMADGRGDIIRCINEVYDIYTARKKKNSGDQIFIMIKNLQFMDIIKSMLKGEPIDESDYLEDAPVQEVPDDPFDFGMGIDTSAMNVSDKLLKLIDDGTAYGIFFIIGSIEFQSVKECMYFGENTLPKFPERYVFSLNDSDAESLIENISVKSLKHNTVYYSDSIKNTFQVKPYVFPSAEELHIHLNSVIGGNE